MADEVKGSNPEEWRQSRDWVATPGMSACYRWYFRCGFVALHISAWPVLLSFMWQCYFLFQSPNQKSNIFPSNIFFSLLCAQRFRDDYSESLKTLNFHWPPWGKFLHAHTYFTLLSQRIMCTFNSLHFCFLLGTFFTIKWKPPLPPWFDLCSLDYVTCQNTATY